MGRTFGALLAERRAAVVGREAERAALAALLEPDGPLVAIVHGIAGTGKSALLRAFAADATARGATVATVDARTIEPTPQGFRAALPPLPDDGPVVLTIDTAERLRLLEDWLRGTFLPALPERARVVIATRDAPGAAWRAPFGELLVTVPVGRLAPDAAAALLREAGLDGLQAAWVDGQLHGHPLSLQLAASALRERGETAAEAVLPSVLQELAALYLDGLDAPTRDALEAACVLRQVTLSLLAALVGAEQAADAFKRLRALPFAELGREGLVVHDAVREAVAALLRATDPVRERAYRTAAWRQIRRELADVPRRLLDSDPLCQPWRRHLRAHPLGAGERVLLARTALAWATGAAPSPCFAAVLRDVERASLEAGPTLRRIYSQADGDALLAQLAPLGYVPLPDCPDTRLGGVAYRALVCDLGPESLTGWLSTLAARDLRVGSTALDADARELVLDGRRIGLTKLECDVLCYLRDRVGRPVAREALLRDVWGYEWTGGSNVVEVAISGLRRKLGDRAAALETVRGVGYRLRAL